MTLLVAAVLSLATPSPIPVDHAPPLGRHCPKTFTLSMDHRAADLIYHQHGPVSHYQRGLLRRLERCQRRNGDIRRARHYNQAQHRARRQRDRQRRLASELRPALASYYSDHGTGACGVDDVQNGLRFASLFLPCGAHIEMCHAGRCVTAEMADHGPYVAGRTFDLNVNLLQALACGGLCEIEWRPL